MPSYEYMNDRGEILEIFLAMNDPKPAAVVPDSSEQGWRVCSADDAGAFIRQFTFAGSSVSKGSAVATNEQGLPVSRSLPARYREPGDGSEIKSQGRHKFVQHKDGMRTDLTGGVIVANKEDRDRAKGRSGYTEGE